jgi:CTP synthase
MPKYIFIAGGVISGLGKGITTASIGRMFKTRGYSVTAVKIDPYVNIDAGTMRPTEHGEVWVTDDGGEIDQDLGHYERFIDEQFPKKNNITTGQVYRKVIKDERKGKYLGKTVQLIPHIVEEVERRIESAAEGFDVCLVEIGGTVGDYENIPFMFAAKNISLRNHNSSCFILVVYLPVPHHLGEMKTKPAQHAVKAVRELGINPDIIVTRSEMPLDEARKKKIAVYQQIDPKHIISNHDVKNIYEIPLIFEKQDLGDILCEKLGIQKKDPDFTKWNELLKNMENPEKKIKIGMIAKYFDSGAFTLTDSYVSINEALHHAGAHLGSGIEQVWFDAKEFEKDKTKLKKLSDVDRVMVLPGFGSSCVEGKILAAKYCRENKIPYLGICFGMQLAVVEFARNVCGMAGANTIEVDPDTKYPVVTLMQDQIKIMRDGSYGATKRLGAYKAILKRGTKVFECYKKDEISERHRHRYEINPEYLKMLEEHGMIFSGTSPDGKLMEFMELRDHPFFVGTQAHPEYKSTFLNPSPLYVGFLKSL